MAAMHLLETFTFATFCVFLPTVPVTHSLGLLAHCPPAARLRHILLYPIKGGRHHFIFQVISWAVWVASLAVAAPVVLRQPWMAIPSAHVEILAGAAAVGSVCAELFMIKSLLVFDPKVDGEGHASSDGSSKSPKSPRYKQSKLPKPLASVAVLALGLLWASMGGALLLATEFLANQTTKQVYFVLSGVCVLVGVTTTHGLGGQLRHASPGEAGQEIAQGWRFFQPFQGGVVFIATQALGWLLFSSSVVLLIRLTVLGAWGMAYCVRCWVFATGSAMLASQILLAASVWLFRADIATGFKAVAAPKATAAAAAQRGSVWVPVCMMYVPVHFFFLMLGVSFAVLPPALASAAWVGGMALYYGSTMFGEPEHNGRREWPAFRDWFARSLTPALTAWMGSVEVVNEGQKPLDPARRYVFGYAPHGLFPIGAPYLPLLSGWRAAFPGVRPVPLVASVIFFAPIIRDFVSWCGVRQVSKRTFVRAMGERGSVILVPGGQAELLYTGRLTQNKEFVIYPRHKGFVRVAAQQGAALVPVLCLGELSTLRNLIDLPAVQAWTYKKFGFPVPYLVVGRWTLTPFPRRTPLRFVVGAPIDPPELALGREASQEQVDAMHKRFYDALEAMWHKHHPSFPEYKDVKLVMAYK